MHEYPDFNFASVLNNNAFILHVSEVLMYFKTNFKGIMPVLGQQQLW
jgi:hypothetical protein